MQLNYDLVIIGGGPAGINCGIEASKAGLDCVILEKGMLVNSIYNFPANMTFFSTSKNLEIGDVPFISHTDKPTRQEALEYYRRVVEAYQLNIVYRCQVESLQSEENLYHIKTSKGNTRGKHIIIATGFYDTPNKLNIAGEELPKVKHYYDDAHQYIGAEVCVIGGANSACDVALETWSKGANVTMVVRDSQLYEKVKYWILPNIQNRIEEGSIKAYFNSQVTEIADDHVTIESPDGHQKLENDYVLAMLGYRPNYPLLKRFGIKITDDAFKTPYHNPETLESNLPNVYLCGVILGGLHTSKYFIENTRGQAEVIIKRICVKA